MPFHEGWPANCLITVSWPVPEHEVYYLLVHREHMPAGTGWLSPREAKVCETFRFPKRRGDWLLGRWTAKQALLALEQDRKGNPSGWEILADDSGAPEVHREGAQRALRLSLSHSSGLCLCTLSQASLRLGCDLERVEPRSSSFEETYFETAEIEMLETIPGTRRPVAVTLVWSAKESVLKALRTGLSADTRRARILKMDGHAVDRWQPFNAVDAEKENPFTGWWMERAGMVMTVVTDNRTSEPIQL